MHHKSKTRLPSNSSLLWPSRVVLFTLLACGVCLLQYTLLIPSPAARIDNSDLASALVATISQRQTTPLWVDSWVDRIARPFVPFHGSEWCQVDHQQSQTIQQPAHFSRPPPPPLEGLMLAKVHKAGSTTAASVTVSIAYHVAQREQQKILGTTPNETTMTRPMCHSHFYHDFAMSNHHSHRNVAKSFLWTTVRLPHARAESAFYYFQVLKEYDNDEEHLQFLSLSRGHQLRFMRKRNEKLVVQFGNLYQPDTSFPKPVNLSSRFREMMNASMGIPDNSIIETDPERLALEHVRREVLDTYNFVAVTERWAESMVVLKLLLPGVLYSDLVVLRTKERGSFVPFGKRCKFIPVVTSIPDRIKSYLDGPFRDTNPDYLLYAAVNRSLDMTIESLGRERVEEGVRLIQYLQSLAQENCMNSTIPPCSGPGLAQSQQIATCETLAVDTSA